MSGCAGSSKQLGLLFMAGLPGRELDDSTRELVKQYCINNFIIFKRNVETPKQLGELCAALRSFCRAQGLDSPLIAIDQEGGTVTRLPPPFTQFPDARVLAEGENPEESLLHFAQTCARELRGVGINMNLAPVLDICPVGQGFFMERRSLSDDPGKAARLGSLIISEMQKGNLAACAKHFPGLGTAKLDPHEQLPSVAGDRETLFRHDLIPFKKAITEDVAAIMTSHTVYSKVDPKNPATLSPTILSGLLRDELGYQGVVVTDDLEMGAIENEWSVADAGVKAFLAGADLLLICHEHEKVIHAHKKLESAVASGLVDEARLQSSLARVREVQRRFEIK